MTTLDKATVADIRAKVNDALSGISLPHVQQDKLEDVWRELAEPDTKSAATSAKTKAA